VVVGYSWGRAEVSSRGEKGFEIEMSVARPLPPFSMSLEEASGETEWEIILSEGEGMILLFGRRREISVLFISSIGSQLPIAHQTPQFIYPSIPPQKNTNPLKNVKERSHLP